MSSNPFIGDVQIALGHDMWLDAAVTSVEKAKAAIVFVHGSGSGRLSPRSQAVAAALNRRGFATVLADLLTTNEKRVDEETLRLRFNIS
ncbi:MAG TPA: alpha/beta hydrolase, partial [Thermoanaerobaculia bacterium]|nr:alpha/beta hydrolase [Thermoanaerobaculia bacterium]